MMYIRTYTSDGMLAIILHIRTYTSDGTIAVRVACRMKETIGKVSLDTAVTGTGLPVMN